MHLKIAFFRNEQILNKPFEKTKWAPASREEYWRGMFPGWGRVEPLGFPTTLGTPAQSRWSTPPRAQKKATAGEGEDSSLAPPPLGS